MRRLALLALSALLATFALISASSAAALPPNPWTGQWLDNNNMLVTLTQSGSQITGTSFCPGGASPPGVTLTGTASADNTTANFSYQSAVCTGTGGTFTGTMNASGRRVDGSGVTQFGTGFSFSWTYQGGGNEPREAPPAPPRPPCAGGPWSGLWTGDGSAVISLLQNGTTLSGTVIDVPETITGTISGNTARATFRVPEGTGTWQMTLAPDQASISTVGTTTTGARFGPVTSTFIRCATGLPAVDLTRTIPAPQTLTGGPTTIVAPGIVSITSLTRSKCVLVKVASARPARILVSIFSGRRSVRLFGQKRVVFTAPGRTRVCIPVPFRAHTFNVRTRLNVALGYVVGATPKRGERKPPPVIRRIKLVP